MARPRKDSEGPSGKERIKQAFWTLYTNDSPERATVKEICAEAGCNKTTFYYHYRCVEDVLAEIEQECIPHEAPVLIAPLLRNGEGARFIAEYVSSHKDRYEKMCYLLGPHGDPAFSSLLKTVMVEQWERALGFKVADLHEKDRLLIDFIAGGMLSMFAQTSESTEMGPADMIETLGDVLLPLFIDALEFC